MTFDLHCPLCSQSLEAEPEHFGVSLTCPACGEIIDVPRFSSDDSHGQSSLSDVLADAHHPSLPPNPSSGQRDRRFLAILGVKVIVLISASIFLVVMLRPETTKLRAIDAVALLPLAPTAEAASKIEFHYNEWDRADKVKGASGYPVAHYRAEVRVLHREAGVAHVQITGGTKSEGWVPEDWLETYAGPVARRQNKDDVAARREADSFLRLSRKQIEARLGKPANVITSSHPTDGPCDILVYDTKRGAETFFTIWGSDDFISSGQFKGTPLTPLYK